MVQGGIVFGAGFDEDWEVCHQSVERVEDLGRLRVSKYLQSRIETTFQQVARHLRQGRRVLFAGTPCQCVALRRFVGKNDENLVLVDFICHGVPSPKIWRNYLALRARKKKSEGFLFATNTSLPISIQISTYEAFCKTCTCVHRAIAATSAGRIVPVISPWPISGGCKKNRRICTMARAHR